MSWLKTFIGLIVTSILVIELCAFLEGTNYINFNYLVPTLLSLIRN